MKKLKNYLLELEKLGVTGRLNPCVGAPGYELEEKRLIEVYLDLARFCLERNLRWSPFTDIVHALQGKPRVCIFSGCDPFSTPSATVLLGDGSITNCMRTNQEYILLRHPAKIDIRSEILTETPQEYGGCKNCKYWTACYGGCPTAAINRDWRNRTYLCPLWKALFQFFENVLSFVEYSPILPRACIQDQEGIQNREHGDWTNIGHGDSPHGDWFDHQDS